MHPLNTKHFLPDSYQRMALEFQFESEVGNKLTNKIAEKIGVLFLRANRADSDCYTFCTQLNLGPMLR